MWCVVPSLHTFCCKSFCCTIWCVRVCTGILKHKYVHTYIHTYIHASSHAAKRSLRGVLSHIFDVWLSLIGELNLHKRALLVSPALTR